jgi:hypothetical protein
MSSRFEKFLQNQKKSSRTQDIFKLNLDIAKLKKSTIRSTTRSSFLIRRYKEKEKTQKSSKNEEQKSAEFSKTNQEYTKTKYNNNHDDFVQQ